jgi:hypothetical protein
MTGRAQFCRQAGVIDSTIAPTNDLESAIVAVAREWRWIRQSCAALTTAPASRSWKCDLDQSVDSKLANISTRGFVQPATR